MNQLLQNIAVFILVFLAVYFLFTKYIYNPFPGKKKSKGCGSSGCGCE